jgi:hypothetical protein
VKTYTTYAVAVLLYLGYLKDTLRTAEVIEHRAVIPTKNTVWESKRFTVP